MTDRSSPIAGLAPAPSLLPLLIFVVINALGQWVYYGLHAHEFVAVAVEAPTPADTRLFVIYTLAMLMGLALLLFLVGATLQRSLRRPGLDRLYLRLVVFVESLLLLLILVDSRVYTTIGLHLDSDFVVRAVTSPHFFQVIGLSAGTWIAMIAATLGIVLFQALLSVGCRRLVSGARRPRRPLTLTMAGLLVCIAVFSGWEAVTVSARAASQGRDVVDALPMFQRLLAPSARVGSLHYPDPGLRPFALARRPHVLYILVESLRADTLNPELMPNLWRFVQSRRDQVLTSTRHYSGGHTTEYGTFSYLFGLDAYHYYPMMQAQQQSFPLAVLKANGYQLSYATSSSLRGWFNGAFVVSAFDRFAEYIHESNDRGDERLLSFADESFRAATRAGKPMFTFLFFSSTHHNYIYPPAVEQYRPVLPRDYNHFLGDAKLKAKRLEITNRYKNSVRYVDHLIGELLNRYAAEIAAGNLVLAISGDHGEEFWEFGLMGHGASRFNNPRTQVPLVLYLPGVPGRRVPLSSHADVLPTLLDYMGPQGRHQPRRYSSGQSLLGPVDAARTVVVSGTGFPFTNRNVAVIHRGRKYWLYRQTGAQPRFRCRRVSRLDDHPLPPDPAGCEAAEKALLLRFHRFIR